jgi:hypothetical protein
VKVGLATSSSRAGSPSLDPGGVYHFSVRIANLPAFIANALAVKAMELEKSAVRDVVKIDEQQNAVRKDTYHIVADC